jgi:hypothetical protein
MNGDLESQALQKAVGVSRFKVSTRFEGLKK